MSYNEFKARALYDFAADGPNELSFHTGDVLTITSTTAGHGWWYAKNSMGHVGVIPENYVETMVDLPEPQEPPPPLTTFSPTSGPSSFYPSAELYHNTNRTSYPGQNQYMNPMEMVNSWQNPSVDSYNNNARPVRPAPPIPFENRAKVTLFRLKSLSNGYATFVDAPSNHRSSSSSSPPRITTTVSKFRSFETRTSVIEDEDGWYGTVPLILTPILSKGSNRFFESSQTMTIEKNFKKKHKIPFRFIRTKKFKLNLKSSHQSHRRDSSDDDSFTDQEDNVSNTTSSQPNTPTHHHPTVKRQNTLTLNSGSGGHGRPSIANAEQTRAAPKARFFDKHGLDNYLLNGAKAKSDEHVEIIVDEITGVMWSPNPGMPPFSCKVENPSKEKKLAGLKQFIEYKILPQIPGGKFVGRRYKQFDWLHEQLVNKFRFICIPPLPGKQIAGRFEDVFIEERRRLLELWLNRICRHPVLCATQVVQHFISCELTEKNKKDWKNGKRKAEKDESKDAAWLQCVHLIRTGLTDQQIQSQIDTFAGQQPALESNLKNLSQGINKYLEKHTENYEKDLSRISELFFRVHTAVSADTATPGNRELAQSISKIGESYKGMGESYRVDATEGLRNFNERLQEYIGIVGCFPSILSIQRSATDFMRTVHQRAPAMNNDYSSAIHRNHVLNHVVLAEINFFQREKVADLNNYLKTLMDEQIHFYEKLTEQLRDASRTFK